MIAQEYQRWSLPLLRVAHAPRVKRVLRPMLHAVEDLFDGNVLAANAQLRDRHKGRRCFLILPGSPLNEIDLDVLDGEWTFGCGHLHGPELDTRPNHALAGTALPQLRGHHPAKRIDLAFYMGGDRRWPLVTSRDAIAHIERYYPSASAAFTDPDCIFFLDAAERRFMARRGLLAGRRLHFLKSKQPMREAAEQTHDLTGRITFRDGSVFAMMAAALYMGFSELYLCGAGYTYAPLRLFNYYDEPLLDKAWPADVRQAVLDRVREHVGGELLRIDDEGNAERPIWIARQPVDGRHHLMNRHANAHGVRIFNVVPDGFTSPVYTPVSWNEVRHRVAADPGGRVKRRTAPQT